jgi:hypothetical protein
VRWTETRLTWQPFLNRAQGKGVAVLHGGFQLGAGTCVKDNGELNVKGMDGEVELEAVSGGDVNATAVERKS